MRRDKEHLSWSPWLKTDQGKRSLHQSEARKDPKQKACWHCGAGNPWEGFTTPKNLLRNPWRAWVNSPGCQHRVKKSWPPPQLPSGRPEAALQLEYGQSRPMCGLPMKLEPKFGRELSVTQSPKLILCVT